MRLSILNRRILYIIFCSQLVLSYFSFNTINASPLPNQEFANLLLNPEFEDVTGTNTIADVWELGAWSGNYQVEVVGSPVSGGTKAQKITASGLPTDNFIGVSQMIKVEPNKAYSVSGRFFVENLNNAKVQLYIDFFSTPTTYANAAKTVEIPATTSGQYVTLATNDVIPANAAYVRIYALIRATSINGSVTFYVDSMNFNYSTTPNLLSNSDFESNAGTNATANSWELGAWSGTNQVEVVGSPISGGTKAQKITASELPTNHFIGVSQMIKVEPNKAYSVSGRFFVENLNNAKVQLYADFFSTPTTYANAAKTVEIPATTSGQYVTLATNDVIPANAAYVRIYALIRATSINGGGTFYVDSMNFNYSTAPNLLSNSDFESNAGTNATANSWELGAWSGNYQVEVVETPISGGTKAQKITASELPTNHFIGVSQMIKVEPNKAYSVSGRFFVENLNNAKVQLYADFFSTPTTYANAAKTVEIPATTSGQYVTLATNDVIPANAAYVRIYALVRATSINGGGTFYVDSMNFNYSTAPNLLSNSDFESNAGTNATANSWELGAWSGNYQVEFVGSPISGGTKAQKITASGLPSNHFIGVSQMVKVEPNKAYSVSGRFFVENLNNAKVQLYADFFSTPTTYANAAKTVEIPATTSGHYVTLATNDVIPANAAYVRIYALVRATSINGSGTFYVDSMNFNYSTTPNQLSNSNFESNLEGNKVADNWYYWSHIESKGEFEVGSTFNSSNGNYYIYDPTNRLLSNNVIKNGIKYKTLYKYDKNGNQTKKITLSGIAAINPVYSGIQSQKVVSSWLPISGITSINQTIVVQPSKSFTVIGNFNVELLYRAKVQLYIDFYDATFHYLSSNIAEYLSPSNGQYVLLSSNGITPGNAVFATVHLIIRATNDDGAGSFYSDNVVFKYN